MSKSNQIADFAHWLFDNVCDRKLTRTGVFDSSGKEILLSDIITFYSDGNRYEAEEFYGSTKCIDIVIERNGELLAFEPDQGGGAFMWRVAGKCKIAGSLPDDVAPLAGLLRFRDPIMANMVRIANRNSNSPLAGYKYGQAQTRSRKDGR